MPTTPPRAWSGRLLLAVGVGLVGICVGMPLSMWRLLRGESAQVEAPSTKEVPRTLPTQIPEAWSEPGCAMPIVVRSIHGVETAAAALQPALPAGHRLPEDVDLHIILQSEYGASIPLGPVAVGDTLDFGTVPCSQVAGLSMQVDGFEVGRIEPLPEQGPVVVPLAPLQRLSVMVVDALDGQPIRDARSTRPVGLRSRSTGADGVLQWARPQLRVTPQAEAPDGMVLSWTCPRLPAEVHAPGYRVGSLRVPSCAGPAPVDSSVEADLEDFETTVALEPARTVYVHCIDGDTDGAARPCPGDLSCMPSWSVTLEASCVSSPAGVSVERTAADLCYCPQSEAVVRGLGQSVAVPDGVVDIYLDLSSGTGVQGHLLPNGGTTRGCSVVAERVAAELSDLGSIGAVGRVRGACDAKTRRFEVRGLSAGDWVLEVQSRETDAPEDRLRVAVAVPELREGEFRDLGGVDVRDGSALTVLCTDGLTGDELDDLMAFILHDGSEYEVGYAQAVGCGRTQHPVLSGEWDVFVLPYAHVREHVVLGKGASVEVELVVGDDDSVRALGATLGLTEHGLEVLSVEPRGLLARHAVQPGDELVGIAVFGLPLPLEDYPAEVMSGVLGIWGASGVSIEVRSMGSGDHQWIELGAE